MSAPLYISRQKVKELITMAEVIQVVQKGLEAFSSGKVVQPVRSVVPVAEAEGYSNKPMVLKV